MHDIEEKNLNSLKYFEYSYVIKDIRRTFFALKVFLTHKTESKTFVLIPNEYLR